MKFCTLCSKYFKNKAKDHLREVHGKYDLDTKPSKKSNKNSSNHISVKRALAPDCDVDTRKRKRVEKQKTSPCKKDSVSYQKDIFENSSDNVSNQANNRLNKGSENKNNEKVDDPFGNKPWLLFPVVLQGSINTNAPEAQGIQQPISSSSVSFSIDLASLINSDKWAENINNVNVELPFKNFIIPKVNENNVSHLDQQESSSMKNKGTENKNEDTDFNTKLYYIMQISGPNINDSVLENKGKQPISSGVIPDSRGINKNTGKQTVHQPVISTLSAFINQLNGKSSPNDSVLENKGKQPISSVIPDSQSINTTGKQTVQQTVISNLSVFINQLDGKSCVMSSYGSNSNAELLNNCFLSSISQNINSNITGNEAHQPINNSSASVGESSPVNSEDTFQLNSKYILKWLAKHKELCKDLEYPLPLPLINMVAALHKAIFECYILSPESKEADAMLKVYKNLDRMLKNDLKKVNDLL